MKIRPVTIENLAGLLRQCSEEGARVESIDLGELNMVVEYTPEDMTATAQGGMTLAAFQEQLRANRQWLACDPAQAESLTIADLVAFNRSGPRRFGCGVIRDYLIGIRVVLATGDIIKAGGKVVKNVAGYDLCKLFVGSHHSLGAIVEATFKLRPLPESERFAQQQVRSRDELRSLHAAVLETGIDPVVLDAHNLDGAVKVVIGFAGAIEDVEEQLKLAERLGFRSDASLEYNEQFWAEAETPRTASVLPSQTGELLQQLGSSARYVCRLGNGVVYYRGSSYIQSHELPGELLGRLKTTYDPKGILPGSPA